MSDDVVALLDHLNIQKADIVGWSDGGLLVSIWRFATPHE
jgi:pimeloyl-ACP methyl ester carboxylesterase